MTKRKRRAFLISVLVLGATALPAWGSIDGVVGTWAVFEGSTIDLGQGWGEARACAVVDPGGTAVCFRTEQELDVWTAASLSQVRPSGGVEFAPAATCSSAVKLYDGANYGLPMLQLVTRNLWMNLSGYGFDNKTSSFKVGACNARLADGQMGAGDWYPLAQSKAGMQVPVMASGWNNRVSSVYQE